MEEFYPSIHDNKFADKFNRNKEFIIHKYDKDTVIDPKILLTNEIEDIISTRYKPYFYQNMVRYIMSPNTPYNRILLKYNTGSGKTRTMLDIAMEFIKVYRTEYAMGITNQKKVYIIGFTKEAFKNELLKYPEFGFISKFELDRLNSLKTKSITSSRAEDRDRYMLYRQSLRRRITNERLGGFFKFYGYREFFNMLYVYIPKEIREDGEENLNVSSLTEDSIELLLASGEIKIDTDILKLFAGSLLICDEIHEVYNKHNKNSWGVALQTVLDHHKYNMKAIFASATPLNNSPLEIINIGNLLIVDPKDKLKEEELFNIGDTVTFKPRYEIIISNKLRGKIAFVNNIDPRFYPKLIFEGKVIPGIDYLKFIPCEMGKFQHDVYTSLESINLENHYIIDIAVPSTNPKETLGYVTNSDFKRIKQASNDWKSKNKLDVVDDVMIGEAFHIDNINKYSSKYYSLLKWINKVSIPTEWTWGTTTEIKGSGKIFIYHRYVNASGVKLIANILRINGYIGRLENVNNNTKCAICDVTKSKHSATHDFKAARFIVAYSEMSSIEMESGIDMYNSKENVDGCLIKFLIGAGTVAQSRDFKAIRYINIMFYPNDISKLIQIIGRGNRTNSHIDLPESLRQLYVNIFVTTSPSKVDYEVKKYRDIVHSYKLIQSIEQVLHEVSVDNSANADMNKRALSAGIGPLDYKIQKIPTIKASDVITTTYSIFRSDEEIDYCKLLIKRLFIGISRVWEFNDLWEAIKSPPFSSSIRNELISKNSFIIALNSIYYSEDANYVDINSKEYNSIQEAKNLSMGLTAEDISSFIYNSQSKYIILLDGSINTIIKRGNYYILTQLDDTNNIIDSIEAPYRTNTINNKKEIDMAKYMETVDPLDYYERKKNRFINKYKDTDLNNISKAICEYNTEYHIKFIEDCIYYIQKHLIDNKEMLDINNDFYFKILYYYDILGLVIFADTIELDKAHQFKDYVLPSMRGKSCKPCNSDNKSTSEKGLKSLINMLESSIENSECSWCPNVSQKKVLESIKLIDDFKKSKIHKKVVANLLPVGHRIGNNIRILHPVQGWYSTSFSDETITKKYKENDMIIGYDEKSKTGIFTRFKIRNPKHKQQKHQDLRLMERGMVCTYKNKQTILDYLKKLGVDMDKIYSSKHNIYSLCEELRSILILKELNERQKNSNIKYFYYFWEKQ